MIGCALKQVEDVAELKQSMRQDCSTCNMSISWECGSYRVDNAIMPTELPDDFPSSYIPIEDLAISSTRCQSACTLSWLMIC